MDIANMTPRRPYMLRAFYDWLVDSDLTPHIVVAATLPGVHVPVEFVQDGQIILNIAPRAVGDLDLGNEAITFNARFSGRPHSVIVPLYAVQAIYARENGAGTMFEPEDAYMDDVEELDEQSPSVDMHDSESSGLSLATELSNDDSTPDDEPPRPKGRPSLRVVK
ncbi:ClpXP protease specificity-enhancing factor [Vibrio hepatarius]|uniref:ClpXP protease specificity-enhancing factor n=1 Tax=Vibrio hepatarius TaxID=171383 RepID=UPI001C09EEB0|nr:ClpXP protease specificity-enhancing factor [Vibrio hepatarius]MBU2896989.1 ClpXP protease specificity-enhancing factor [Vibrio hepatarius]